MRRRSAGESKKDSQKWMITYSDLVTLLLCFFVLLFAFSEIDAKKFQAIMESFQGSQGIFTGGKTIEEAPFINTDYLPEKLTSREIQEVEDLKKLKGLVESYANTKGLSSEIQAIIEERGLIIRILNNVFFDSGKATIKPEAKEIILDLGDMLKTEGIKDKFIKIEGHTDTDRIIGTSVFKSNWDLSGMRACNVLTLLVNEKNIHDDRISFSGYAFTRPVAPNDTYENKAKNRRVEIVILKSFYNKWESN